MNHCKSLSFLSYPKAWTAFNRRQQCGHVFVPLLLMVLSVLAFAAAAWQWQRSHYHDALAAQVQAQQLANVRVNLNLAPTAAGGAVTVVQGTWVQNSTVFVSPRIWAGISGSWLVGVLAYSRNGQTHYVAVHRGWARQTVVNTPPQLPPLPRGVVTLEGVPVAGLGRAYELSKAVYKTLGLWQNYDLTAHSKLLGLVLDEPILVLTPSSRDTEAAMLVRQNPAQSEQQWVQKADTNRGYAVQWLGIACVGVVGLMWMFRSQRRSKREPRLSPSVPLTSPRVQPPPAA